MRKNSFNHYILKPNFQCHFIRYKIYANLKLLEHTPDFWYYKGILVVKPKDLLLRFKGVLVLTKLLDFKTKPFQIQNFKAVHCIYCAPKDVTEKYGVSYVSSIYYT